MSTELGATESRRHLDAVHSRLRALEGRTWNVILVAAWAASAAFVAWHLNRGWVPHDDGILAQSAQRVLDRQLPHRDFVEIYTGGLTFLNAAVFAIFGENLIWLRVPMFILFVAYVPCVYAIARYFATPSIALLAALFAVAWGPATYPAAMPSWYLLFFTAFGALSLLRYLDTSNGRWLLLAGLFGGLALSFKSVGIFYVIAVLLFLVFVEQESRGKLEGRRTRLGGYGILVIAFACLSLAFVLLLLFSHLGGVEIGTFVIPLACVCGLVVANEMRVEKTSSSTRLSEVLELALPFLIGVAVPVALVMLPYAVTGSLGDFFSGVLVKPRTRLEVTYLGSPDPFAFVVALPIAFALIARCFVAAGRRRVIDCIGVACLAALVVTSGTYFSHTFLWTSARQLAPFVVLVGTAALALLSYRSTDPVLRRGTFLLLAVATFASMVQYPFGAPIYFCYCAPLFAVAAIAVSRYARAPGALLPVAVLVAFTLFGFAWLDREAIYSGSLGQYLNPQTVILDHRRASIRVTPADRTKYRSIVELLRSHARGRFTYAGPDAPEIYFLTDLKNPTRSYGGYLDKASLHGSRLLQVLNERGVTAVAINLKPSFSDHIDSTTLRELRAGYPVSKRVGSFEVRWKAPTG